MGVSDLVFKSLMFLAVFGLIFGSGDSILVSLADDDELIPLDTVCKGKTLQQWIDDGFNVIRGTDGKDKLRGTSGPDVIAGGKGNDDIKSKDGDDIVCGGDGKDKIRTQKGDDWVDPGSGKDDVKTGKGDDMIFAQDLEKDKIDAGKGDDVCHVDEIEKKIKKCEVIITPYMGFAP